MSEFELSDDEDEITENNSNESVIETPTNSVSTDQALLALNTLRTFFQTHGSSETGYSSFYEYERALLQIKSEENTKQTRLPEFFKFNITLK